MGTFLVRVFASDASFLLVSWLFSDLMFCETWPMLYFVISLYPRVQLVRSKERKTYVDGTRMRVYNIEGEEEGEEVAYENNKNLIG